MSSLHVRVCACTHAHIHTHTHTHDFTKYGEIWRGETESRKEIQRKMGKHNKHSNAFPLKFIHMYLLKKLKTGRRRNIWTKDRENSK